MFIQIDNKLINVNSIQEIGINEPSKCHSFGYVVYVLLNNGNIVNLSQYDESTDAEKFFENIIQGIIEGGEAILVIR